MPDTTATRVIPIRPESSVDVITLRQARLRIIPICPKRPASHARLEESALSVKWVRHNATPPSQADLVTQTTTPARPALETSQTRRPKPVGLADLPRVAAPHRGAPFIAPARPEPATRPTSSHSTASAAASAA